MIFNHFDIDIVLSIAKLSPTMASEKKPRTEILPKLEQ